MPVVYHEFLIRHLLANMINTFNKFMAMNVCSPNDKTFHTFRKVTTKVEVGGFAIYVNVVTTIVHLCQLLVTFHVIRTSYVFIRYIQLI